MMTTHWVILCSVVTLSLGTMWYRDRISNPAKRVGLVAAEMKDIHRRFRDSLYSRGVPMEQKRSEAERTALKLAGYRKKLAALAPQLDPSTELSSRLDQFLEQWPDAEALSREMRSFETGEDKFGPDITGLWMKAPDRRRHWKTPFPMFRP